MKFLYPAQLANSVLSTIVKAAIAIALLVTSFSVLNAQTTAKELVFQNGSLVSGVAGTDNAIYRFPSVMSGVDAMVKINGRSSAMVQLVSIDLTNTGFDKAFQPQVTYGNNTSPAGNTDWWMEFQVSFVKAGTSSAVPVSAFSVTSLDIDGNNDKISEYQSYYGLSTYTLEQATSLVATSIQETVNGKLTTVGKRFDGPVTNYTDIDTSATTVMATINYSNTSSFRLRTGAKSTGVSGAADRMYSLWFKSFAYDVPVTGLLPVTLINWTAALNNNNVSLKWSTTVERNSNYFIVERSFDGNAYSDAAMVFAAGNSDILVNYAYNDKIPAGSNGLIYYRLKMVDLDGNYKMSPVKVVRVGQAAETTKISTYPNPVVNEVRVTVPQSWQGKPVTYQVVAANGQSVKSYSVKFASQTETINMSQVPAGMYVVRVINGNESAVQSVVKTTN
jgi:hypothetical protein